MSKFIVGQSVLVSVASRSRVAGQIVTIDRISGAEAKVISQSTSHVGYIHPKYLVELIKPVVEAETEEVVRQEFVTVVVNGETIEAPEVHNYTLIQYGKKTTIKAGSIVTVSRPHTDCDGKILECRLHTMVTVMYEINGVVWANIVYRGKFVVAKANELLATNYQHILKV